MKCGVVQRAQIKKRLEHLFPINVIASELECMHNFNYTLCLLKISLLRRVFLLVHRFLYSKSFCGRITACRTGYCFMVCDVPFNFSSSFPYYHRCFGGIRTRLRNFFWLGSYEGFFPEFIPWQSNLVTGKMLNTSSITPQRDLDSSPTPTLESVERAQNSRGKLTCTPNPSRQPHQLKRCKRGAGK